MTTTKKKTTRSSKLPTNAFQSEILALVSKQRSNAKKAEVLKEYANDALKVLFVWNFDSSVITILPSGTPPYKPNEAPAGTEHTSLRREFKYLYNFVKGGNDGLNNIRRETMFVQILEGLHPDEAELLCLVKDKKLTEKYKITRAVVEEAFPDIRWGGRS